MEDQPVRRDRRQETLVARVLERVDDLSLRKAAEEIGGAVTHDDVKRWRSDSWQRLTEDKARDLTAFLQKSYNIERVLSRVSEGATKIEPMRAREESPEDAVADDLPDVSYLKPKARAFYFKTLGEWYDQWTSETVAGAARELTAYFRGERTLSLTGMGRPQLTEEEQMMVLEGMKPEVEKDMKRRGVRRS